MTTASVSSKVFADRIGRIEVSATMAVAAEAAKLRAQGINLVDFGAGEPHFNTPEHIKQAAIDAINANFTRYTVVPGIPDVLRVTLHGTEERRDEPTARSCREHIREVMCLTGEVKLGREQDEPVCQPGGEAYAAPFEAMPCARLAHSIA